MEVETKDKERSQEALRCEPWPVDSQAVGKSLWPLNQNLKTRFFNKNQACSGNHLHKILPPFFLPKRVCFFTSKKEGRKGREGGREGISCSFIFLKVVHCNS